MCIRDRIFGDVDAEGGVLLDTVGVEVIELVVDGLDARDRLVRCV